MESSTVDYEVIDGDGHIMLPHEWWKPYLPKKYWDWAPQPSPNSPLLDRFEGRVFFNPLESDPQGTPRLLSWCGHAAGPAAGYGH